MILIDYSGVSLSAFMTLLKLDVDDHYDISLLRHMVLNSIRKYTQKFKKEYGQVVLCADSANSWRKIYYPYYKANRRGGRDSSGLNWDKIYKNINELLVEFTENLPYVVLKVANSEGDDIIGVLSQLPGKHLIVSNDKDMVQLYESERVHIYSNVKDTFTTTDNVDFYLFEHICRGDTGDGVPNILSDDDTLITPGKRQKSLYAKELNKFYENKDLIPNKEKFNRNKMMIDLKAIPNDIQERILESYNSYVTQKRNKIYRYFAEKKLTKLLDQINDF